MKEVKLNYGDFSQFCYLATDCIKVTEQRLDSTEFIEVETWEITQLLETLRSLEDKHFVGLDIAYMALDKLGHL